MQKIFSLVDVVVAVLCRVIKKLSLQIIFRCENVGSKTIIEALEIEEEDMKDHHRMRAWDKQAKVYDNTITFRPDGVGLIEERFDLELCTGLRDKNGVLIYEGDIVERELIYRPHSKRPQKKYVVAAVFWDEKRPSFRIKYKNPHFEGQHLQEEMEEYNNEVLFDHATVYRIIGNIHQGKSC